MNYADDSTYPAKWYPDEPDAPARWYRDNDPKRDYTKYTVVGGGFIRRKYWGKDAQKYGDYCTAKCHYELRGCTQVLSGTKAQRLTSKYLNPGVAKADNQANVATYKKAVEEAFNVHVVSINTSNTKAKDKRVGKYSGKTKTYKKAMVKLAAGESIDL